MEKEIPKILNTKIMKLKYDEGNAMQWNDFILFFIKIFQNQQEAKSMNNL